MRVSVIIPALNEADRIETTLHAVRREAPHEILVVDGGSGDGTRERAAPMARVLRSTACRALQMNRGAREASGGVFFFLHADSLPPPGVLAMIRDALHDPLVEGGAFRLRFDRTTPLLRLYSFCTRFPVPHLCFGDRGLFVRRTTFEAVGGFAPLPVFEDLDLVRRLHARGGFRFLPARVTTAARRFERVGPLRQQLRNARLWLGYLRGVDPSRLAPHYPYLPPESDSV